MNDPAFLPPKDGDDASYAWLDEWLCEYVDGTMDPSLKANFEKYIDANPELKAHIEQLNETRDLLGQRATSKPPSKERRKRVCERVRSRVCRKVECEMLRSQESLGSLLSDRSRAFIGIASSMAVALVVGIFTGALLFGSSDSLLPESLSARSAPSASSGAPLADTVPSSSAPRSTEAVQTSLQPPVAASSSSTLPQAVSQAVSTKDGAGRQGDALLPSVPAQTSPTFTDAIPPAAPVPVRAVNGDWESWAHVWYSTTATHMTLAPEAAPSRGSWGQEGMQHDPFQYVLLGVDASESLSHHSGSTTQPVLSIRKE